MRHAGFLPWILTNTNWKQDAAAVMDTCKSHYIPSALERSRSGNGGHVWLFFEQPIDASLARKLGSAILTKTRERYYQLALESYDRFFPNQDTLPKGGFGNLIALPLQGGPRVEGNSVFIDDGFRPYHDQWSFLSAIKKISLDEAQRFIYELTKGGSPLGTYVWNNTEDENSERPWIDSEMKNSLEVDRFLIGFASFFPT